MLTTVQNFIVSSEENYAWESAITNYLGWFFNGNFAYGEVISGEFWEKNKSNSITGGIWNTFKCLDSKDNSGHLLNILWEWISNGLIIAIIDFSD